MVELLHERMNRLGFLFWPDDVRNGLFLVKKADLDAGENVDALGYGNVYTNETPEDQLFYQADPHHPEYEGYESAKSFMSFASAVNYLLDDYERLERTCGLRTGSYLTFGVTVDTTDAELIDHISKEVRRIMGNMTVFPGNSLIDCSHLNTEPVSLRGEWPGVEVGAEPVSMCDACGVVPAVDCGYCAECGAANE
jgi:hypothetical protein